MQMSCAADLNELNDGDVFWRGKKKGGASFNAISWPPSRKCGRWPQEAAAIQDASAEWLDVAHRRQPIDGDALIALAARLRTSPTARLRPSAGACVPVFVRNQIWMKLRLVAVRFQWKSINVNDQLEQMARKKEISFCLIRQLWGLCNVHVTADKGEIMFH